MSSGDFQRIPPTVPLVDTQGRINPIWYRFFLKNFGLSFVGQDDLQAQVDTLTETTQDLQNQLDQVYGLEPLITEDGDVLVTESGNTLVS
jgi:hypothetical protein